MDKQQLETVFRLWLDSFDIWSDYVLALIVENEPYSSVLDRLVQKYIYKDRDAIYALKQLLSRTVYRKSEDEFFVSSDRCITESTVFKVHTARLEQAFIIVMKAEGVDLSAVPRALIREVATSACVDSISLARQEYSLRNQNK